MYKLANGGVEGVGRRWIFYFAFIGAIDLEFLSLRRIDCSDILLRVSVLGESDMLILLVLDFLPRESMSLTDCESLFSEPAVLKIISRCIIL